MKKSAIDLFGDYEVIQDALNEYNLLDFNNVEKVESYANAFSLKGLIEKVDEDVLQTSSNTLLRSVNVHEKKPYEPKMNDLARLHWLILKRKVINTLEFGSGFSTAVIAQAESILKYHFSDYAIENFRVENPFHIYSVEEEQRFLDITNERIVGDARRCSTIYRSSVEFISYQDRYATKYSYLPNISPDFIYLDGPSQFANTSNIGGFEFCSISRFPMSADLLYLEFFMEPGTMIMVDGRTSNARFLKAFFKRNWKYFFDQEGDIHLFELQEEPLGRVNSKKLQFTLHGKWML
jgi:hypothetical protein